jgi:hemerythrin-like domain-containing protein
MLLRSGLGYDKQNNKVQTSETNEFLALIHSLSTKIEGTKNGDSIKKDQISALVTSPGFKPGTS